MSRSVRRGFCGRKSRFPVELDQKTDADSGLRTDPKFGWVETRKKMLRFDLKTEKEMVLASGLTENRAGDGRAGFG